MYDYEKLGSFYLGRRHDMEQGQTLDEPLLYDSKDLTTHAICVGMTGSGKTGLCLDLLEEAAIDGVPAIAIDPKGDLGNLLLTFPNLEPADFEPWVDEGAAERKGLTREEYAAQVVTQWREGLASWDQPPERIARFRDAVDLTIYTPGSSAGMPLSVLRSFAAPPEELRNDNDFLREKIVAAVSGLLALLGIEADPIRSREHILLATLLDRAWRAGEDMDIASLIGQVQSPPLEKVGIIDLETFYPEKNRIDLAMQLNNLLASPSFAAWMEGEPLDVGRLLYTAEGKPRLSIISITHLSEQERMFVVTLLLSEVLAWVRSQAGTTSLRALLYMDEVFGYFPPTANPPSKTPMLTLLKQARAYGLGVVLATQNPVDLDYKGLSNTGTWFLGRLQTERDKRRVLEGLEGASAQAGSKFNRGEMEATLAGLGSRVFLMNNVHDDEPVVMQTRWALSYLRGPLTRTQIQKLMAEKKAALEAAEGEEEAEDMPLAREVEPGQLAAGVLPADLFDAGTGEASAKKSAPASEPEPEEVVPPKEVKQYYAACAEEPREGRSLVYRPVVLGRARLRFIRATFDVDAWEDRTAVLDIGGKLPRDHVWDGSTVVGEDQAGAFEEDELQGEPEVAAARAALPPDLGQAGTWKKLRSALKDHLYQSQEYRLWNCEAVKMRSEAGESEGDFRVRLQQALREKRDEEVAQLKDRYEEKVEKVQKKIASEEKELEQQTAEYRRSQVETAQSWGSTLFSVLLSRKKLSKTNFDKGATSARSVGRAANQRADVKEVEAKIEALRGEIKALDLECRAEIDQIKTQYDPTTLELEPLSFPSRKNQMKVEPLALVWTPWEVDPAGAARRLYRVKAKEECPRYEG